MQEHGVELVLDSTECITQRIKELNPRPIDQFQPDDALEQMDLFLAGEIDAPNHVYGNLNVLDIDNALRELENLRKYIQTSPQVKDVFRVAYTDFIDSYIDIYIMMGNARTVKTTVSESERNDAAANFMRLNEKRYGSPDKEVTDSFIAKIRTDYEHEDLPHGFSGIRDELMMLLPQVDENVVEPYRPKPETVEAMQSVVKEMYGGILQHVPDREEKFSPVEVAEIFSNIINEEFGEGAEGWSVALDNAASVQVAVTEKKIIIPVDRLPISTESLRKLVVHEVGVHMLRAVMGESTNLPLMSAGLSEYYTFEEGTGIALEQALTGAYEPSIRPGYLAAGLAAEGRNFREVFEIMWRYQALKDFSDVRPDTEDGRLGVLDIARKRGYISTRRIFRGTDELPWFKDIAYHLGIEMAWRFFDSCVDKSATVDELVFMQAYLGRINPDSKNHRRVALETSTI